MKPLKVLYAGDSPAGGPANYLLAILRHLKAECRHVEPGQTLKTDFLKYPYDVIILSDYGRDKMPAASETLIQKLVQNGAGLGMVGGWGSFSGPFGGWRGSRIEKMLPVQCLDRDDRLAFPAGAPLHREIKHPILNNLPFEAVPSICGINRVRPKAGARVALCVRPIKSNGKEISLAKARYPLLVLTPEKSLVRSVALATDLAPHWCGGWVDWGKPRKLPVRGPIAVEVGEHYIRFVSSLILWLARRI